MKVNCAWKCWLAHCWWRQRKVRKLLTTGLSFTLNPLAAKEDDYKKKHIPDERCWGAKGLTGTLCEVLIFHKWNVHVKWEKREKDYICQLGCHMLFWPEHSKNGDNSFLNENLCQLLISCFSLDKQECSSWPEPKIFVFARKRIHLYLLLKGGTLASLDLL